MSDGELQHLINMANQISQNCFVEGREEQVLFIETHIRRFWSRSMKSQLSAYVESGGEGLDERAQEAALRLNN